MNSLEDALKQCKTEYQDRVIFIIGSFYTYKEVLENLEK